MKRTGELLRRTREEKGLSVHEVGLFLKINPRILQAIEEGDQSQLPAKTFLRGFVQSYAKFLKLDPQEVLQIFAEEMSPPKRVEDPLATAPSPVVSEPVSVPSPDAEKLPESEPELIQDALKNSILTKSSIQNDALRVRTFAVSVIGLVLVFVIYFVNSVVKRYQREAELVPEPSVAALIETPSADPAPENSPKTETPEPAKKTAPQTPSSAPSATLTPATAVSPKPNVPGATPAPAAAPSATTTLPTPQSQPQAPAALSPKPTVTPAVVGAPAAPSGASTTAKPTTPAASTTPAATPAPKPAEGKLTEVIVEANQNVEIEYSSSKSSPQKLVLRADQIHTFKSRSGVRLKISNGGAVNVIVNGQDLGAPGASGQAVQLAYE